MGFIVRVKLDSSQVPSKTKRNIDHGQRKARKIGGGEAVRMFFQNVLVVLLVSPK